MNQSTFGKLDAHSKEDIKAMETALKNKQKEVRKVLGVNFDYIRRFFNDFEKSNAKQKVLNTKGAFALYLCCGSETDACTSVYTDSPKFNPSKEELTMVVNDIILDTRSISELKKKYSDNLDIEFIICNRDLIDIPIDCMRGQLHTIEDNISNLQASDEFCRYLSNAIVITSIKSGHFYSLFMDSFNNANTQDIADKNNLKTICTARQTSVQKRCEVDVVCHLPEQNKIADGDTYTFLCECKGSDVNYTVPFAVLPPHKLTADEVSEIYEYKRLTNQLSNSIMNSEIITPCEKFSFGISERDNVLDNIQTGDLDLGDIGPFNREFASPNDPYELWKTTLNRFIIENKSRSLESVYDAVDSFIADMYAGQTKGIPIVYMFATLNSVLALVGVDEGDVLSADNALITYLASLFNSDIADYDIKAFEYSGEKYIGGIVSAGGQAYHMSVDNGCDTAIAAALVIENQCESYDDFLIRFKRFCNDEKVLLHIPQESLNKVVDYCKENGHISELSNIYSTDLTSQKGIIHCLRSYCM